MNIKPFKTRLKTSNYFYSIDLSPKDKISQILAYFKTRLFLKPFSFLLLFRRFLIFAKKVVIKDMVPFKRGTILKGL